MLGFFICKQVENKKMKCCYCSVLLVIIWKWKSVVSDSLRSHGLYSPQNSLGQNIGVSSCSLLQEIFPTQGLNPGLPHCRQILYCLSHQGNPGNHGIELNVNLLHTRKSRNQSDSDVAGKQDLMDYHTGQHHMSASPSLIFLLWCSTWSLKVQETYCE